MENSSFNLGTQLWGKGIAVKVTFNGPTFSAIRKNKIDERKKERKKRERERDERRERERERERERDRQTETETETERETERQRETETETETETDRQTDRQTRGVLPSKRLLGMCRWMGRIFTTRLTIMGLHF